MLKSFAPIELQTIVAAYVAKTHESILVRNLEVHRTNFFIYVYNKLVRYASFVLIY